MITRTILSHFETTAALILHTTHDEIIALNETNPIP